MEMVDGDGMVEMDIRRCMVDGPPSGMMEWIWCGWMMIGDKVTAAWICRDGDESMDGGPIPVWKMEGRWRFGAFEEMYGDGEMV